MKYFRIGTLNCQNNSINRNNKKNGKNDNAYLLAHHILDKKYDILGTQELTRRFTRQVDDYLEDHNFYGSYSYGLGFLGTKIPLFKEFNQGNQIVTVKKVVSTRTKGLPWFPWNFDDLVKGLKKKSISRRIATIIELEGEYNRIYVINTHLDYYLPKVQQRQLNYLLKKVKKYNKFGFVVLMGDFNLQITNPMFKKFEMDLNVLGIRRVPVNEKTNAVKYKSKTAIDHIFIPKSWQIVSCGTFDTKLLSLITDHKAVYVDVII